MLGIISLALSCSSPRVCVCLSLHAVVCVFTVGLIILEVSLGSGSSQIGTYRPRYSKVKPYFSRLHILSLLFMCIYMAEWNFEAAFATSLIICFLFWLFLYTSYPVCTTRIVLVVIRGGAPNRIIADN